MILTETEKDYLAAIWQELKDHDSRLIETNKKESHELVKHLMCWLQEELERNYPVATRPLKSEVETEDGGWRSEKGFNDCVACHSKALWRFDGCDQAVS